MTFEPGDIIFEPELTCLCGSDTPFFRGEVEGYPLEPGMSLHEMIGTVVDTNGKRFKPGDRVLAVPLKQQGFFERYRVSEERAIPLDPRCSPEQALLAQPLGTVIYGMKKLPTVLDQNVAVVGQGPIGQLFCAVLRNLGANEIIALDRVDERLEVSPAMGATTVINVDRQDAVAEVARVTDGVMADVVVEAVGHEELQLNFCADLAGHMADVLLFGVPSFGLVDSTEMFKMFLKNLKIHTTVNPDFERDFPLAMRWIAEKRLDVMPVVTHSFPVTKVQEAFELFRDRREGALKVFLTFRN